MSDENSPKLPPTPFGDKVEAWLSGDLPELTEAELDFDLAEIVERDFQVSITPDLKIMLDSVGLEIPIDKDSGFRTVHRSDEAADEISHNALLYTINWTNLGFRGEELSTTPEHLQNAINELISNGEFLAALSDHIREQRPLCAIVESFAKVDWLINEASSSVNNGLFESVETSLNVLIGAIKNAPEHLVSTLQKKTLINTALDRYAEHMTPEVRTEAEELLAAEYIEPNEPVGQTELDRSANAAKELAIKALSGNIATTCMTNPQWSYFVKLFVSYADSVIGESPDFITEGSKRILIQQAEAIGVPSDEFFLAMTQVDLTTKGDNSL